MTRQHTHPLLMLAHVTLIKQLVSELLRAPRDSPRACALAERINVELDALKANLG